MSISIGAGSMIRSVGRYETALQLNTGATVVSGRDCLCASVITREVGRKVYRRRTAGVWFYHRLHRHRHGCGGALFWTWLAVPILSSQAWASLHSARGLGFVCTIRRRSGLRRSHSSISRHKAQPHAAANAGNPSRLHFNILGPAWLRWAFGNTPCASGKMITV